MAIFELILELSGELIISGLSSSVRKSFSRTWVSRNLFIGKDEVVHHHHVLHESFKYYRALKPKGQKLFRRRVSRFLKDRNFVGKQGVTVTEEMKVLIASSAVKLTFGLDDFEFEGFKNIFIYPEQYYSRMTGNMHKGETHPLGAVVFSWSDFDHGISDESDNLHLGIHEFTHALVLEMKKGNMSDPFFMEHIEELRRIMSAPKIRKAVIENGYLRDYASANFMEFLAVSVESYFETPDEFKQHLPPIYDRICRLLNQDTHLLYRTAVY